VFTSLLITLLAARFKYFLLIRFHRLAGFFLGGFVFPILNILHPKAAGIDTAIAGALKKQFGVLSIAFLIVNGANQVAGRGYPGIAGFGEFRLKLLLFFATHRVLLRRRALGRGVGQRQGAGAHEDYK